MKSLGLLVILFLFFPQSVHDRIERMQQDMSMRHAQIERDRLRSEIARERVLIIRANRVADLWNEVDFLGFSKNWNEWTRKRNVGVLDVDRAREITRQGRQIQQLAKAFKALEKTNGWPKE
jgi:hypothetical protein